MDYKDYYKILGVAKDATQDEIKSAYRRLARQFHPDLNKDKGAEERFKEVGEAFEVLGDVEKRAAYDALGTAYRPGQEFTPPPDWDAGFEFSGGFARAGAGAGQGAGYSDFFEDLFGEAYRAERMRQAQAQSRGQDHHARVLVDLEDSFNGARRTIQLKVPSLSADGHVTTKTRTLNVTIPKGVRAGQHIRLKGQGMPGLDLSGKGEGKAGDLYLEIEFRPHPFYSVEGRDLYVDLPVTPWEAALGGKVKAPTPKGPVDVTIPAGSKQGKKLRLKGRGLPAGKGGKELAGDLYIVLQIALPSADSDEAKRLYQEMAEKLAFNPRAALGV